MAKGKKNVPIDEELHEELLDEKERTGVPITVQVRKALEERLERLRRERDKKQ